MTGNHLKSAERKRMRSICKNLSCSLLMILSAGVFLLASIKMIQKQEPFHTWFYCFAWWSYILFCEAYLFYRGGNSTLFCAPRKFLLLLPLSVSIWLVFEAFNFRLQNWHYLSVPSQTGPRWIGYAVSFATVLPGIFTTSALLENAGIFRGSRYTPLATPSRLYRSFTITGIVSLLLPLLWPHYFFPLVWVGFIFLLEPINHSLGAPSLLKEWQNGSIRNFYLLLAAGLFCGFLWEFWNFWAGSKWIYTIPYLGWLKIFEMPLFGFFGFPPFALECFVMANAFIHLKNRLRQGLTPRGRLMAWIALGALMVLFDLLVFMGIDHFTVHSFVD